MSRFPSPARGVRRTVLAALLAGTALGGFTLPAFAQTGQNGAASGSDSRADAVVAPKPGAIQPNTAASQLPDFSNLVAQVKPAVVSITSMLKPSEVSDEGPGAQGQMPFPFPFGGMMPQRRPQTVEARGSGFIIDPNGTIVTNNHVVHGARSVSVTLDDGTELPAKVVGTDPRTDLAVLRVEAGHKLPFINLGNSNDVRPGQWVVAVGNPFGLGGTVTAGIVSARGRDIGDGPYDSFLQIDAPINQGNSGGPLFTQDGKVVGVNTAILSPTGGSVGIGFAIPSDTVKTVVAQLEKGGHVTRGYLGVEAQAITPTMSAALDLKGGQGHGALVASVQPDSPAQNAGLQPGDVITAVNGQAVANPRDLAVDIAGVQPGDAARLNVLRNGNAQDMSVTVANLANSGNAGNGGGTGEENQQGNIGLALAPLSPDMRSQLNLPAHQAGAVVAQVQPDSPAAQAGLRQGDVVVGVGNHAVSNPSEAVDAIHAARSHGHAVALRIVRDGQSVFVAVGGPENNSDQG